MMQRIRIDCSEIVDWESFHDCFSRAFGFPEWYGRNMDAWIDCMDDLEGMTSLKIAPGDMVVLCLSGASDLKRRCPEIWEAVLECSAFVNWRRLESGRDAILMLAFG